jgi:hypothetical protein
MTSGGATVGTERQSSLLTVGATRRGWMAPRPAEGQCVFLLAAKVIQPKEVRSADESQR